MRLRRGVLALTLAATVVVAPALPAGAAVDVVFDGSGWGHGVGMSQYGAYGMTAIGGADFKDVLAHYYTGSTVQHLDDLSVPVEPLWVNLERDRSSVVLIAKQTGLGDPADVVVTRGDETWTVGVNERIDIDWVNGTRTCDLEIRASGGSLIEDAGVGTCDLDIDWDGFADTPTRKIEIDGCEISDWNGKEPGNEDAYDPYRPCQYGRGRIVVRAPGPPGGSGPSGEFDVSLIIDLDDYVMGISESPYFWGLAKHGAQGALQAQAVAARSYALARQLARGTPGDNSCRAWCHVKDTAADQRYVGWGHGWDTWIDAVNSTAGLVVTHAETPSSHQGIVEAFYFSSSGGATENNEDVWGGNARAYLRSVDDHWALLDEVPNTRAEWTRTFTPAEVAAKVGLDQLTSVHPIEWYESGSVKTVEYTGIDGGKNTTVTRTGKWTKSNFSLNSRYFQVNYGPGGPPDGPVDIDGTVHKDDILWLWEQGIALPCDDGADSYCPDDPMIREDMAAFVVRALDLPATGADYFIDDDGLEFEGDINSFAAAGITFGCNPPTNNLFCPDDPVTRGQMAAFFGRGWNLTEGTGSDLFIDDDSSVFEGDIDRLGTAGITYGCNPPTNTMFCPTDLVTRGQMASFIARALRNLGSG
jgi:SpoIID/LytB domain protein